MTELLRMRLHIYGGSQSLQRQLCDLATLAGAESVCFDSEGRPSETLSTPTRFALPHASEEEDAFLYPLSTRDSSVRRDITIVCDDEPETKALLAQRNKKNAQTAQSKEHDGTLRIDVRERYRGLTRPSDIVLPGDETEFLTRLELLSCTSSAQQFHFVTVDHPNLTTTLSVAFVDYLDHQSDDSPIAWVQTSPLSGKFHQWSVNKRFDSMSSSNYASVLSVAAQQNHDQSMILAHCLQQQMLRKGKKFYLPWGSFVTEASQGDSTQQSDGGSDMYSGGTLVKKSEWNTYHMDSGEPTMPKVTNVTSGSTGTTTGEDLDKHPSSSFNATSITTTLRSILGTMNSHWHTVVTDEGYFSTEHLRIYKQAVVAIVFSRTTQSFIYLEQLMEALKHIRSKVLVHYSPGNMSRHDIELYAAQHQCRQIALERPRKSRIREWVARPQRLSKICQVIADEVPPI